MIKEIPKSADVALYVNQLPIKMNLAFFNNAAGEKTEKATPRKRKKSREEGQVAQSQEIGTAFLFIAAFIALRMFAPRMINILMGLMHGNILAIEHAEDFMSVEFMSAYIWGTFLQ
ncbi:MAG: EscU/YscU/HrcU family type III secretion system export apparatus switch protein, partial [Defluviitaleaceae bacterium]|nr:EscU/YscU/HrcU family type III secretion system export apparatus switch protein [Defluviitaleaceae bacterium]